MINVIPDIHDDSKFIEGINAVVNYYVRSCKPQDVYISKIDNYFGENWALFSGKIFGAVGMIRYKNVNIPPFHPNRVIFEQCYHRCADDNYELVNRPPLHVIQSSEENFRRYIDSLSKSGVFMWFSGQSRSNGKASLMIYFVEDSGTTAYYVLLESRVTWHVVKAKGVSAKEFQQVFNGKE